MLVEYWILFISQSENLFYLSSKDELGSLIFTDMINVWPLFCYVILCYMTCLLLVVYLLQLFFWGIYFYILGGFVFFPNNYLCTKIFIQYPILYFPPSVPLPAPSPLGFSPLLLAKGYLLQTILKLSSKSFFFPPLPFPSIFLLEIIQYYLLVISF